MKHNFHIPVMGLAFTIDTPLKVAQYGIASAISIMDDLLLEQMRAFYAKKEKLQYTPIEQTDEDGRAKRITAYLDLAQDTVQKQITNLKNQIALQTQEVEHYFDTLPDFSELKNLYQQMKEATGEKFKNIHKQILNLMHQGSIDVNIMTKLDRTNYDNQGNELPQEYSHAMAGLRGFAKSKLKNASVILSAGLNQRLYAYFEQFDCFYPDAEGYLDKKVILKVSDYRSALIQGKMLAKRGIWISEFRIESGLNCGGHAFATDGLLLGPIMEDFKQNREKLSEELLEMCNKSLLTKGKKPFTQKPVQYITVQGGIGTSTEHQFLLKHYQLDATGWGSPFLLVPEATSVDDNTLIKIVNAKKSDYYLSEASPLGVPFNNLRNTTSEEQIQIRIQKNRPGSACYKKIMEANTEFTPKPICTASRQYQHLKIKELQSQGLDNKTYETKIKEITAKDCLCEGLSAPALLNKELNPLHNLRAVTICPGPNLAYFNNVFSLKEMLQHIYGEKNILKRERPHIFANELELYIKYLKNEIEKCQDALNAKKVQYFNTFKDNLLKGISYYKNLIQSVQFDQKEVLKNMEHYLQKAQSELQKITISENILQKTS